MGQNLKLTGVILETHPPPLYCENPFGDEHVAGKTSNVLMEIKGLMGKV